jgi:D-inositol-3-phosphate glycosyltransferase
LKAPHVLLRAAAELAVSDPDVARRLTIAVCGGPSGTGLERPTALMELAGELGLADRVRFLPPRPPSELADVYRAADLVGVPSHNESFGLVALEAQACGTPVVAAAVGGLVTAVADGVSGVLIDGHHPVIWARVIGDLLRSPVRRIELARGAAQHARGFSWTATANGLLTVYREAMSEQTARFALAGVA